MRIGLASVSVVMLVVAGCAAGLPVQPAQVVRQDTVAAAPGVMSQADITLEVTRLRAALRQEVPRHTAGDAESDRAWISRGKAAAEAASLAIAQPQLLVVVDRNPAVQELRIVLAQPGADWQVIGGSKVSTGQAGRRAYFITPIGAFLHTDDILDYRALGTFNENHIRGLGLKGMRVWDLGWQTAERGWRVERDTAEIRLLMHATDPDYLEQRLGRPASEGCVRIPATMNRFLDLHGVLDADYERALRLDDRLGGILLRERQPTSLAGDALVVVDSSQAGSFGDRATVR
jgi:hypothetical protein